MDDTLSRHGRDGAGAPIWRYAGTRTRAAVGGFRQRGPALPIRFSHGDLVWDQVAIRLLCIRCDVLRPISGSRRLESMDRRLFTMMSARFHQQRRCSRVCEDVMTKKSSVLLISLTGIALATTVAFGRPPTKPHKETTLPPRTRYLPEY